MARRSRLSDPNFAKAVAEAYIDGCTRQEMADLFGVSKDTITAWTRDTRVQAFSARMVQDRVTRITRKIDSVIEGRLQEAKDLDTETLLKIRKEYLDRSLKVDLKGGKDDPNTIEGAADLLESNPDFAAGLIALLEKQGVPSGAEDAEADETEG